MHINGILRHSWRIRLWAWLLVMSLVTGCVPAAGAASRSVPEITPRTAVPDTASPTIVARISEGGVEYRYPEDPSQPAPTAEPLPIPTAAPEELPETPPPLLWISPAMPKAFLGQLEVPEGLPVTPERDASSLRVEIPTLAEWQARPAISGNGNTQSYWIYALAAPFPTLTDEIRSRKLRSAWEGQTIDETGNQPLLMAAETLSVLESYWGPANRAGVRVSGAEDLLDIAWETGGWAILPFEEISPRWKILRIGGQTPLDRVFDPESYPLAVPIWISGPHAENSVDAGINKLPTNRDPGKLTTLVMTGVTALARHIGERMETKGVTYPAADIGPLLANADITHISNEVSFYAGCPAPGPERADMRFCSAPKYIELLEAAGTDVVELTGNHNLDWGAQPFLDSLELYRQRGWGVYGGGENLSAAREPLLVVHNGNRIAFIGCSPSGPENVWATADRPGSAPCDFSVIEEQVRALRQSGILPVVTLQAIETDTYLPAVAQGMPLYRRLARAGAVIVSGSQSHVPQTMTFVESGGADSFVHYGLGNLFFDQMKPLAARQQFIDRHIFYDGKYLGVELITTLLEDYARPRPMTAAERAVFLEKIFALSTWNDPLP